MLTSIEIRKLLQDIENERVERTISTTNTDKFAQAVCAFANDIRNSGKQVICSLVLMMMVR